jgi:hypothetical protein
MSISHVPERTQRSRHYQENQLVHMEHIADECAHSDHNTEAGPEAGATKAGHQIGRTDELQELGVVDPSAAAHQLVAHHRDVRCRTSEPEHTQSQEHTGNFAERLAHTIGRGRIEIVGILGHPR